MAWMVLWMLLVSSESFQDVVGSCANETCDEENAMVQLLKAQSSSLPAWILGGTGQSCKDACEALEPVSGSCDLSTMQDINIPDLFLTFQNLNPGGSTLQNTDAFPSNAEKKAGIEYTQTNVALVGLQTTLHVAADRSSMTCDATPSSNNRRRMCYCTTAQNNDGLVDGDPHVHTLRGAHYTLLRHGLFRAWSFKKGQTDLELLAAYGKPRFTTQGLLLKEKSGKTMEMTARDCAWHTLRGNTSPTQFEVQRARKHKEFKDVFLQTIIMKQEHGKIAKLVTKCRKGNHLDFKVNMFEKSELVHVGGQLGAAPGSIKTGNQLVLLGQDMSMKADSEFKVDKTWQSLGGSEEAGVELESKMSAEPAEISLLGEPCTEEATTICAKHFPKDVHSEVFLNCIFDTCRGGDEADAATAAELMSA